MLDSFKFVSHLNMVLPRKELEVRFIMIKLHLSKLKTYAKRLDLSLMDY